VTSFFGIKGAFVAFISKTTRRICVSFFFFSGFRRKTYSLQPALKSSAPGLKGLPERQPCGLF